MKICSVNTMNNLYSQKKKGLPKNNLSKNPYSVKNLNTENIYKNHAPVNFCANPLYKLHLKSTNQNKLLNARFVKIDPGEDEKLMLKVFDLWENTEFYKSLKYCFGQKDAELYAVIKEGNGKEFKIEPENVLGMVNIEKHKDSSTIEVKILQTLFPFDKKGERKIKGAGETAMYGVTQLALDEGFEKINLFSCNNDFYENIGMKAKKLKYRPEDKFRARFQNIEITPIGGIYELYGEELKDFAEKVENKYSMHKKLSLEF